jgi:hypothetical protein
LTQFVWQVTEGQRSDVRGAWTGDQNGSDIDGNAVMGGPQGQISYGVTGRQNGSTYNITRVNPSDGVMVAYQGTDNGTGTITGVGRADNLEVPWSAVTV